MWWRPDGPSGYIWSNRYTAGTGWGTAALIETDRAFSPRIAIDANGNALAVWWQFAGTRDDLWSNRYTAATGWGSPQLIETDNAGIGSSPPIPPQIAFDPNGNALAVWIQSGGTEANIWFNRYTAGTGWGTAAHMETDNAGSASAPQIAFDPNGNALAVWSQRDGMHANIWSNRYSAGIGWGAAALIETENAGDAISPQIAIDANGHALAVWTQSDGTRVHVRSNRYTAATGWGTAAPIETDNAGDAGGVPQITFDPNGNALTVWTEFDGTRNNIWANRFQ